MYEIFNKRCERKVANALPTADCKAIWLMVTQSTSVPRQSCIRHLHHFSHKSTDTEMLMNKVLTSGKHKTGCLAAETQESFIRGRNHCQMGSCRSLQSDMFKSQNILKILLPEGAFFFTSLNPSNFKKCTDC